MCKLWLDDVRPAPKDWLGVKSVNNLIATVELVEKLNDNSPVDITISLDNDLGNFAADGGEGYKYLDWQEATGRNYPIHIHSANNVAVMRMRQIIEHNNWEEIKSI